MQASRVVEHERLHLLRWHRSGGARFRDLESWPSWLFDAFAEALSFPAYFGRNWDAFDEVISDIGDGDLAWPHDATGLLVIIENGDALSSVSRRAARLLVQTFADASRRASLFGNRLILLLQVSEKAGTSIATSAATSVAGWQ